MSVTERVHTFGESASLGIVTLPPGDDGTAGAAAAKRPFVVILNAGLVHRIGPFRMSVDLARRFALRGSRVLRFDQAGIGDSPAHGGAMSVEEQATDACKAAMDSLAERYGARTFTVGGLCTGAMNAHRVGLLDERVEGMWLLDGYAYPTALSKARHVASSLGRPQAWSSIARRLAREGAGGLRSMVAGGAPPSSERPAPSGDASREALFFQKWPPVHVVRADLERMLGRGARFLFVYTGGWSSFTEAGQFDEMFPGLPGRGRITVDFHPDADHTFLALRERETMFRSVERFVAAGGPSG